MSSHSFMQACYDSLGRYVNNMKPKVMKEFSVQVSYYFQCISVSNLFPLFEHFLSIEDSFFVENKISDGVIKRKREIQNVLGRIKEYKNEVFIKKTYLEDFIFLVFSKKNALRAFEKITKKDMEYSEQFFIEQKQYTHQSPDGHSMKYYFEKKNELIQPLNQMDLKLIGLLRDYLRSIDLNYIDASKSYFQDKFTLKDLLRRDKINKKFTKISHVKMDIDGWPSYSAELAADYILHKLDELNEDIVLSIEDDIAKLIAEDEENLGFGPVNGRISIPNKVIEAVENGSLHSLAEISNQEKIEIEHEAVRQKRNSKMQEIESELSKISEGGQSRLIKFICLIAWENKIRLRYYHQLNMILAKSRAQFESRYIAPFEITMRFGLEALEKVVAYQFVQKCLLQVRGMGIKVEPTDSEIIVSIKEEDFVELADSMVEPPTLTRSITMKRDSVNLNSSTLSAQPIQKSITVNTYEDVCSYMKTSKDIVDFTTLGIDKRNFKEALHRILKHVGPGYPVEKAHHRDVRQERPRDQLCVSHGHVH